MWASRGDDHPASQSSDWGRPGEPGTAFRGLSRGRGGQRGGGRSRGRGGRGRGGAVAVITANQSGGKSSIAEEKAKETTIGPSLVEVPTTPVPPLPTPAAVPASTNVERAPRPKPAARRLSTKKPPPLTMDLTPSVAEIPQGPSTAPLSRPSNRRKKSQPNTKSPSTVSSKQSPVTDVKAPFGRSKRSSTASSTPAPPVKDIPPHLAPSDPHSLDIRSNIDTLVERVRAIAMAGNNRPSTPGSHIDWAVEDDDSLPDLDDWGYSTKSFVEEPAKNEGISPILEGQLKPLPDTDEPPRMFSPLKNVYPEPLLEFQTDDKPLPSKPAAEEVANVDSTLPATSSVGGASKGRETHGRSNGRPPKSTQQEPRAPRNNGRSARGSQAPDSGNLAEAIAAVAVPPRDRGSRQTNRLHAQAFGNQVAPPLPTSLPAKPITTIDTSPLKTTPPDVMPPSEPVPPAQSIPQPSSEILISDSEGDAAPTVGSDDTKAEHCSSPSEPSAPASAATETLVGDSPDKATSSGDAPLTKEIWPADLISEEEFIPGRGLSDSIHAPKQSIPSSHSSPSTPRNFNPTHGRAHTVGRPSGFSGQDAGISPRFSRQRGGHMSDFASRHSRNHSSPPTGGATEHVRAPHSTRPVIAADALSRLARTLGNASPPKTAVAGTSKD
ncbi:hypothetical protein JAAARDRAFT_28328 [Jaapia argillacea MUCL 33604]|uniref:Uncharacterized protein n=1 Tax=Jaapia argillacea MUCL 33604 TaxID=933084 RepID=A0A067QC94_9AGAM|nr:hypothetical protein JAAARDRAFT_28328 [Jaapia argillacea MUCL 33604]